MNLKDFVEETLSSIIDAVTELQEKYEGSEALINPQPSHGTDDQLEERASEDDVRRIQNVAFDIAVTAPSADGGGGGSIKKVAAVNLGTTGTGAISAEQLSRIRFEIPISLPMSSDDARRAALLNEERERKREMIDQARERSLSLSNKEE